MSNAYQFFTPPLKGVGYDAKILAGLRSNPVEYLLYSWGRWGDSQMGRFTDGEIHRWGDSQMGRFTDGEIHRWGVSQMGRFADGEA